MKGISRAALLGFVAVFAATPVLAAEAKGGAAKPKAAAKLETMTPDQMKWVANPGAPEGKTATVWGDAEKGSHGAFHKFPAGFVAPLHTHSADLRIAVVSGTIIEATEDGTETKLGPGSYIYQPHTVKHVTKCDAASECVAFVVASGKFDIVPADAKKAVEHKKEEPKK